MNPPLTFPLFQHSRPSFLSLCETILEVHFCEYLWLSCKFKMFTFHEVTLAERKKQVCCAQFVQEGGGDTLCFRSLSFPRMVVGSRVKCIFGHML